MAQYHTSIKTRQALIRATGELAAEQGFNAVSIRAIARRARQNIGSIHYHFGSKQKLFEAVVNEVAQRWSNARLDDALAGCDLTRREDQARALAIVLRREARLLFDASAPEWHCRVIYQLMQSPDALNETFRGIVAEPELQRIERLIRHIDPGLGDEEILIHLYVLIAPLLLHADYRRALLRKMEKETYDQAYIDRLVAVSIRQALLLFGLPVPDDLRSCPGSGTETKEQK